jgi:hypothetical protein
MSVFVGTKVVTTVLMRVLLPGCKAVWFGDSPTFRKNKSSPFSGSKNKLSMIPAKTGGKVFADTAGFLLCLFFNLEDDWYMLIRNVSPNYTALELTRPYSSYVSLLNSKMKYAAYILYTIRNK